MPPQPPQSQDQPPIAYYGVPTINYNYLVPHYARKTSIGLGVTHIVLAIISIVAGVMSIVYYAGWHYIGVGIWAGIWYLIGGARAVAAGKNPTYRLIRAALISSVFNMVFGLTQIITASCGLVVELNCYHGQPPYYQDSNCVDWWTEAVVANSMMIGVGSLEIIFGLWMAVISGRAIGKGSDPQIATISVMYAPNQPEPVFMQGLPPAAHQSEPPPYYAQAQHLPRYAHSQYPSTSNQQQMIHIGVDQIGSDDQQKILE